MCVGDSLIHVSSIDKIVYTNERLPEKLIANKTDDVMAAIGENVASLIEDSIPSFLL